MPADRAMLIGRSAQKLVSWREHVECCSLSTHMATTVLLIDDSESIRGSVKAILVEASVCDRVVMAANGVAGLKVLLESDVDLVLCDVVMPQMDGYAFLRAKQQQERLHGVPVVMLTGEGDVDARIRGFASGAADYVSKPFHKAELVARTRVHLHNKLLRDQLEALARQDALTGCANRRYLVEVLEHELKRSRRYGHPFSLLMLDIDHFKLFNDEHGHECGDAVLRQVTDNIKRTIRDSDFTGRYGGEEFLILLPATAESSAVIAAEKVRKCVANTPMQWEGQCLHVTVSIGVAENGAGTDEASSILICRADAAMYKAKSSGRNRVHRAAPSTAD